MKREVGWGTNSETEAKETLGPAPSLCSGFLGQLSWVSFQFDTARFSPS
jgi:hypothetical protein